MEINSGIMYHFQEKQSDPTKPPDPGEKFLSHLRQNCWILIGQILVT